MSRLFIFLQYLLPHHGLSRITGWLAEGTLFKNVLIKAFARHYRVNLQEAEIEDPGQFENFNAFFTRALKPGARPLANEENAILCPADGAISEMGKIEADRVLQAKGRYYTVARLLADEEMARHFEDGDFVTVYLSPRDYHRVHMPLAGKLVKTIYVPGKLFSVNRVTADYVPDLFARNERLVCLFDTEAGLMAVVLVGAMIVAGIETVWGGRVCPRKHRQLQVEDYTHREQHVVLEAGAELGRFKLGSTAIVLFQSGAATLHAELRANSPVQMGQLLATHTT